MAAKSVRWIKGSAAAAAVLAALIMIGLALFGKTVSEIAGVGAGYSAKVMCSSVFVSGRDPADVEEVDLSPTRGYPISVKVDRENKRTTATVLGLFSKQAIYRDGLGCTVVVDESEEEIKARAASAPISPRRLSDDVLWPLGARVDTSDLPAGVDRVKLGQALDFAFTDPKPDRPVGTRAADTTASTSPSSPPTTWSWSASDSLPTT